MKNKIYNKKLSLPGLNKVSLSGLTRQSLLVAALFTFFSCTNLVESNDTSSSSQDRKTANGETYLVINSTTVKKTTSRSASTGNLVPTQDDVKPENLTNLVVTGRETSASASEMATLATADSLIELQKQKIKIDAGSWAFKLSAELGGITFSSDTVTKTIKQGVENTVTFVLTSDLKYGGLEITIEWTNEASKVVATLMDAAQTKAIDSKTYEDFDTETSSLSYKRDIKKDSEQLASGTYYLKFDFYNGTTSAIFDTFDAYVNIADGLITRKSLSIELSKTFEIEYHANGGELAEGQTQPLKYSRKSTALTLPDMTKQGYFWGGWYEDESFTGVAVTEIPANTGVQKKLYAKWNAPVIYVSGTGDDTTGDGTEANPFETIEQACAAIIATDASYNPQYMDWTIYIMGDVTGKHSSTKKAGARSSTDDYGRSNIPETLTLDYAKSIVLMGVTEVVDNNTYNPQDMINRGIKLVAGASATSDGTALAIFTEVPITIKNLKISNGSNSLDCYNTTSGVHGGGIYIGANSTVTLDDDTLIINNGYRSAGGIFNDGTLYMVGKSYIGDRNATSIPSGTTDCSNTGAWGAGLYNKGTVYLGTEEKELKGGIYYNFGSTGLGGGIYSECGTIEMHSGTIAYNDGASQGGGIYIKAGTFNMTGGSIHHNSTGGRGGGVYIDTGATFTFTDGTISANWATSDGGGVYLNGIMYMYGTAVIGDETQTSAPSSRAGANATDGNGAGINVNSGKLYMGYSSYTSETDNVTADLDGGIYYNYIADSNSDSKGGGIYANGGQGQPNSSSSADAIVRIHSGTIANNYCENGGAICTPSGAKPLVIGGSVKIPSGANHENDVFLYGNYNSLFIEDSLESISSTDPIYIKLSVSDGKYWSSSKLILSQNASISSLSEVLDKFAVQPVEHPSTGIVTEWIINPDTGKIEQNTSTLYVSSIEKGGSDDNDGLSASSALATIEAAVRKMTNAQKDYTIILNGEILGCQQICNWEGVYANSITIKGKNSSSTDIINANLAEDEEGSALSIETEVPVTLYGITVKGGHGQITSPTDASPCADKDSIIVGGGLYLAEDATVSLENSTKIIENSSYYKVSGNTLRTASGCGAGAYISEGAKLFVDSSSKIAENIGSHYGAGVYIATGGYLKTQSGTSSRIEKNKFTTEYLDENGNTVLTCGGGVYLEEASTFDMYGCYIMDNSVNGNGLGSGIYVNATSTLRMSGGATVYLPNDIYLRSGTKIEITGKLSASSMVAAQLTLESYPEEDDEPVYLLELNASDSSWSSLSKQFYITPQELSNNNKQYWYLNSSNNCCLTKQAGTDIEIETIPTGLSNDIKVTVTSNGTEVENNTHFSNAGTLTFTVAPLDELTVEPFGNLIVESYTWMFEGEEQDSTTNTYTLDTADLPKGSYDLYLEVIAKDSNDKVYYYSYTAQIKVGN